MTDRKSLHMLTLQKGRILIERFSLVKLLGEGGMGQVWQVWDLELGVHVAVKIVKPEFAAKADHVELLKNECRNTRRLVHPNIVRVFDFHRFDDLVFISMEYIEGEDLRSYHRRIHRLTHTNVITLLQPVITALSYAHNLGLVHRDVKAGNVLLDQNATPRLTDFGIAGIFKTDIQALAITSGGSIYSMSPQQLDGQSPRPTDDIYSLGVLMYELLTGNPPFYPDISHEKIRREIPGSVNQQLEHVKSTLRVPDALDGLVAQMLHKEPAERPCDMQEIFDTLQSILGVSDHGTMPPNVALQTLKTETVQGEPAPKILAEIITPIASEREKDRSKRKRIKRGRRFKILALIFALVVIVIGGRGLLSYLSKHPINTDSQVIPKAPVENKSGEKPIEPPKEQLPATVSPAQAAKDKKIAEQGLGDFLKAKNELEGKGASEWDDPTFGEMTSLGEEADALFIKADFPSAAETYTQATELAHKLLARSAAVLQRLLGEGQMALEQGNGTLAQQKFSVALKIDPGNTIAQRGLQRAKTIETVMQLVQSGQQHEQNRDWTPARDAYQEALRLDPYAQKAQMALDRVNSQIKEERFRKRLSDGLAAFHKNDLELARSNLQKAASLKPESGEVRDALAQVDQALRLARIDSLRQQALASEQSEDWEKALKSYLAVLKIDKNVQFAVYGKERALEQIGIAKRIHFFLKKPESLTSDSQLKNALLLLGEAKEIEPRGPRLETMTKELERLVKMAQIPINVTIESDNNTEVAVYKVGKLGKFSKRELKLRPGTYTVVGARNGYQDVRQKIVLKPGQASLRVTIKCRIKI
ncbi:MAG: protein kinase [Desulfobacterales bacterium]